MKKLEKLALVCPIGYYWLQYSPSGGVQWLLPKPWTYFIRQCTRYHTSALPRPSKWPAKLVRFVIVVLFAVTPAAAGAIRSE
jgi:hypothetical protein